MKPDKFAIIDALRAEAFSLIANLRKQPQGWSIWTDEQKIRWAGLRIGQSCIAVPSLAAGWAFDEFARQQRYHEYYMLQRATLRPDAEYHLPRLQRTIRRIRLGTLSSRLLWLIHLHVLAAKTSVVKIADFALAEALWGTNHVSWPRHWRGDIATIADGLTWLHITDQIDDGIPDFGATTALLTHFADLRGTSEDACDRSCSDYGGAQHHHYLANIGRGFLGAMEQFAEADIGSGIREYCFPTNGLQRSEATLRRVGKTGRLVSCFIPSALGEPSVCRRLTSNQHRLLRAVVRETTRARKRRRQEVSSAEVTVGNGIPDIQGRETLCCKLLDADAKYVGFNGNKKRRGLGYYLTTPGGWLAKAGYAPDEVQRYFTDLAVLAKRLGLVAVGIHKSTAEFVDLTDMEVLAKTQAGRGKLDSLHVRIYTSADYVDRWSRFFCGPELPTPPCERQLVPTIPLVREMARKRISRRALALGIDADPSLVSKILNGKKPIPPAMERAVTKWLVAQPEPPLAPIRLPSSPGDIGCLEMLEVALNYVQRGWSVVPQLSGEKQPCVKWKPYQERCPTEHELRNWFRKWPTAGLAVILGPISDLLVIDVDGEEAHAVLVERLGRVPRAPKVISGSKKAHRYHLFFRHPDVATKAKITPWHPKLEFRGNRGIVVLPPSVHKSGRRYAWAPARSLDDLPLPTLPSPILQALTDANGRPRAISLSRLAPNRRLVDVDGSPVTQRFLRGEFADGPNWNDRLFAAACDLQGRGLSIERAESLLLAGAQPWNESEKEIALRTIRSAYSQARVPAIR